MNNTNEPEKANQARKEILWHWYRRKGLGRIILFWFLVLSVIPLTLVSIISYSNARKSLAKLSLDALGTATDYGTEQIRYYFDRLLLDLKQESEAQLNVRVLNGLKKAHGQSGLAVKDFVKSYPWALFVDAHARDLKTFCLTYGYLDLLLADHEGNILFSVAGKDDLGANLFAEPLNGSRLSAAARQAVESGRPVFSDYERYLPMNNEICGFLVNVLLDDQGKKIGLIIFNISSQRTDQIMRQSYVSAGMGHTYLVGHDGFFRSQCHAVDKVDVLNREVDSLQMRLINEHASVTNTGQDNLVAKAQIYKDPFGKMVFGVHRDLEIASVNWAVIAEVEVSTAFKEVHKLGLIMSGVLIGTIVLVFVFSVQLTQRTFRPLQSLSRATRRIAAGDLDQTITIDSKNEIGELADNFNQMVSSLRVVSQNNRLENWFKNGRAELNDRIRGEVDIEELSGHVISFLCRYLDAKIGAVYSVTEKETLTLTGRYALVIDDSALSELKFGEALAGQAARDKETIQISGLQDDQLVIGSGLGRILPHTVVVIPLVYEQQVEGILELGFLNQPDHRVVEFLEQIADVIALAFRVAHNRKQMEVLLEQTQKQAQELRDQEEELRNNNALLEIQSKELKASEERLMTQQFTLEEKNRALERQQAELSETNTRLQKSAAELAQQAAQLKIQKNEIQNKNEELEKTKADLERKADELVVAGKYKSQFLANMSHELRTPLNSLMIFSKLLADNTDSNLTSKQVEYCQSIHDSGRSLFNLINDILDLSKIEAGHMTVEAQPLELERFIHDVHKQFDIIAHEKGVDFTIECIDIEPRSLVTDVQKLHQIITNLLSNAFKFTAKGSVTLSVEPVGGQVIFRQSNLVHDQSICFKVRDTGTGIDAGKQQLIFEAFQQEDGSTNRKYGGTGLGLSISRELATLLGGEIQLESEVGKGSCFYLYLPLKIGSCENIPVLGRSDKGVCEPVDTSGQKPEIPTKTKKDKVSVEDDRDTIDPGDRTVLIIEDEPLSARIVAKFARINGFKCIIAPDGETGLELAEQFLPGGIMLDIGLPGIDGWAVMERLKDNLKTRHIPVHFISASERTDDALTRGAVGYLTKPVDMKDLKDAFGKIERIIDKKKKDLLVVVDDERQAQSIEELLGEEDLAITIARTGADAFKLLESHKFDCIVLDSVLPDMTAQSFFEQLQVVNKTERIPVVVYSNEDIDAQERAELAIFADSILVKGVRSPERLLDETALFLHRIESHLPKEKRQIISMLHDSEAILEGKNILIVDDDMRNVYALSQILQEKGVKVIVGKDGKQGIKKLYEHPETDLVLMDIIMPELDGYEAMRQIRREDAYKNLPIIAVTAKAMKGDRAKCMAAGASDYIAKPVEPTRLLSMLRVWLYG